ncbi:hypothetical protein TKK_0016498 [Trichogramma kaykai]
MPEFGRATGAKTQSSASPDAIKTNRGGKRLRSSPPAADQQPAPKLSRPYAATKTTTHTPTTTEAINDLPSGTTQINAAENTAAHGSVSAQWLLEFEQRILARFDNRFDEVSGRMSRLEEAQARHEATLTRELAEAADFQAACSREMTAFQREFRGEVEAASARIASSTAKQDQERQMKPTRTPARILSGTYDIVSVVETFLESSDNISPFHIAGYNFLHCHRREKEGGSVGLYVREDLAIEKIVAAESIYDYTPEYQIISTKNANNMKLLFATVYRSPEAGYLKEFFEVLYRFQPLYDNVIVTGDFNIHVNRPSDQHVGRLIKQLVSTVPTHHVIYHDGSIHENCLDLVIVRDTSLIESLSRSSSPFAAAHDFIDFEYKLSHKIAPAVTKFTRDFRRVRTETIAPLVEREISIGFSRDGLSLFVVDEAAVGGSVVTRALLDLAVATLSSALLAAADLVAPLSASQPASRRKPWVTSQIRSLIRERDRAYRLFRRRGSSADAYKELRSRIQAWQGNNLDPNEYGWTTEDDIIRPKYTSNQLIPDDVLRNITCRCEKGCGNLCGCRKHGLKCTNLCGFCHGENCENSSTIMVNEIDDNDVDLLPSDDLLDEQDEPCPKKKKTA